MIQLIEVAFSLFILMFFFHVLLTSNTSVSSHDDVLISAYSTLMSLDFSGELRDHVYSNDTSYVKSVLSDKISFPVDVFVCFYNQTCSPDVLNQYSTNRYVLSYYLSGYKNFYPAKLLVIIYV